MKNKKLQKVMAEHNKAIDNLNASLAHFTDGELMAKAEAMRTEAQKLTNGAYELQCVVIHRMNREMFADVLRKNQAGADLTHEERGFCLSGFIPGGLTSAEFKRLRVCVRN